MKRSERGFTLIELLISIAIVALMAGAATMATFQVINVTKSSNDQMTVIRQVQNAGYWISHDTLMAENVIVDNLTPSSFLILTWTEWSYEEDEDSIYHSVTYSLQDRSDGIRTLKRQHLIYIYDDELEEWEETENTITLVAEHIDTTYATYEPDEPDEAPVLTVQIAASRGDAGETREYRIWHRPDF